MFSNEKNFKRSRFNSEANEKNKIDIYNNEEIIIDPKKVLYDLKCI